jgi:hypothetical protein
LGIFFFILLGGNFGLLQKFHPVPHGVTVTCERHTVEFLTGARAMSATSSGFVHLHTLGFKETAKRAAVVTMATVHKQGSVQRFKLAGRLEFSVGQWVI